MALNGTNVLNSERSEFAKSQEIIGTILDIPFWTKAIAPDYMRNC